MPRLIALITLCAAFVACGPSHDRKRPRRRPANESVFVTRAPASPAFSDELDFLLRTGQLKKKELAQIEKSINRAEQRLGVPSALLWCVLFQESRFDHLKNATRSLLARGIGQFTAFALDELNADTDHFDGRTSDALSDTLPLTFNIGKKVSRRQLENRRRRLDPRSPRRSYFNPETSVAASAAYLNNRYQQLRRSLASARIDHDPQLLWLYAAAAYNKGARTILIAINQQRRAIGQELLEETLHQPQLTEGLLTNEQLLEPALRELWTPKRAKAYTQELAGHMAAIVSCAMNRKNWGLEK